VRTNQIVEKLRVGSLVLPGGREEPLEIRVLHLSDERRKRCDPRALRFEEQIEDLLKRLIHGASLTRAGEKSQAARRCQE